MIRVYYLLTNFNDDKIEIMTIRMSNTSTQNKNSNKSLLLVVFEGITLCRAGELFTHERIHGTQERPMTERYEILVTKYKDKFNRE